MTLPIRSGTMDSLTALNQRIIAQVDEETLAEEAAENTILKASDDDTGYKNPDDDEPDTDDEVRGRFHLEDPFEYNRIKEWIEANIFGGTSGGMAELIKAFVNEWDVEFRRQQGLSASEQVGVGATLESLLDQNEFLNGATWLPLTAKGMVPPIFTSSLPGVDGEGVDTGEAIPHIGVASPLTGVTFYTVEEVAAQATPQTASAFRKILRSASDISRALFSSAVKQQKTDVLPIASRTDVELTDVGSRGGEGIRSTGRPPQPPAPPPPEIGPDELTALWQDALGSGPGARGSGARRDITFDRDHLVSQVEDLWNRRMLSPDPAPSGTIGAWVDSYVREAKAFWSGQGGQLDFDTFIEGKMASHPRFQEIYKHKLPGESPEQFLQKFMQPIGGLGQSGEFTRMHTEQAVTSGAGPAEQLQRVSRTREVQNSGGFSQRLARTLQGVGVG